jgi:hypothetical protein
VTIRDQLTDAIIDQLFETHGGGQYQCAYWNLTREGIAKTADTILALPGIVTTERETVNAGTSIDSHTLLIVNHPTVIDRVTGGGYGECPIEPPINVPAGATVNLINGHLTVTDANGKTIYDYQARDDDNGKRRYQPTEQALDSDCSWTKTTPALVEPPPLARELAELNQQRAQAEHDRKRRLWQLADDFALNARDAHNRGNYDAGSAWTTAAAELYAALAGKPGATVNRPDET